jgi:hypothetical protein
MRRALLLSILLILIVSTGWSKGKSVTVHFTSPWTYSISTADQSGGVGSTVTASYESPDGSNVDVDATGNSTYTVYASRTPVAAPGDGLTFYIKRTSGGNSSDYTLNANTASLSYQLIPATGTLTFFNGRGDNTNIGLKVQIAQVSITIPIGSYSTNITLSIT